MMHKYDIVHILRYIEHVIVIIIILLDMYTKKIVERGQISCEFKTIEHINHSLFNKIRINIIVSSLFLPKENNFHV